MTESGIASGLPPQAVTATRLPLWLRLGIRFAFLSAVLAVLGSAFLLVVRIVDWFLPFQEALSIRQAMVLLVFIVIALVFQGLYIVALATSLLVGRLCRQRVLGPRQRRRLLLAKVSGGGFLTIALLLLVSADLSAELSAISTQLP